MSMRRLFRTLLPMITPLVMGLLSALARRAEQQPGLRQGEHAPESRSTALVHQPRQSETQLSQRQGGSTRAVAVDFLSDVLAETYRKVRSGQERPRQR